MEAPTTAFGRRGALAAAHAAAARATDITAAAAPKPKVKIDRNDQHLQLIR